VEKVCQGNRKVPEGEVPGGIVKAAGLGDGPAQGKTAIAKLRLTMPPTTLGDFAFALEGVHGTPHRVV